MYTSVINPNRRSAQKTALIYLLASTICAVFGAVYEIFSHGVYSYFMIYAFAIPLICGSLPFLLLSMSRRLPYLYPGAAARSLYHSGLIALTTGSLMTGVLEIYGTTNHLLSVYWYAGSALILASIITYLFIGIRKFKRSGCKQL